MNVDPRMSLLQYLSRPSLGTCPGDYAAFVRAPHADTIPVLCPSRPGLCSTRATYYTYGAVHVSTGARIDPYVV